MVCVSMLGYIRSLLGVYELCQAEWCVEDREIVVEGRCVAGFDAAGEQKRGMDITGKARELVGHGRTWALPWGVRPVGGEGGRGLGGWMTADQMWQSATHIIHLLIYRV